LVKLTDPPMTLDPQAGDPSSPASPIRTRSLESVTDTEAAMELEHTLSDFAPLEASGPFREALGRRRRYVTALLRWRP